MCAAYNQWPGAHHLLLLLSLLLRVSLSGANGDLLGFSEFDSPDPDVEVKCHILLGKFSNATADFTRCAGENAKPISMCRQCMEDLLEVQKYYESLSHSSEGGVVCKDIFTSQDRVEIISQTYEFVAGDQGLWSRAHCSRCYTQPFLDNSTLTEETETFFALYEDVTRCFAEHPVNRTSNRTRLRDAACDACNLHYQNLWLYFRHSILGEEYPDLGITCFDVLDAMNVTQKIWGDDYNCGRKLVLHIPLIISVIVITTTSSIFYLSVGCLGSSAQERLIPRTNRLRYFIESSLRRHISHPSRQPFSINSSPDQQDTSPGQIGDGPAHTSGLSFATGPPQTDSGGLGAQPPSAAGSGLAQAAALSSSPQLSNNLVDR